MTARNWSRVVFAAIGLLVGTAVAVATHNWSQAPFMSTDQTYRIDYITDLPSATAVPHSLVVQRSAYNASAGTCLVSATLTIGTVGVLNSFTLDLANDLNSDNVIDSNEWSTHATGTIQEVGGQTTATIAPTSVIANCDGYRIWQIREDLQPKGDVFMAPGKTFNSGIAWN